MTTSELITIILWLIVTGIGVVLTGTLMYLTYSDLQLIKQKELDGNLQRITSLSFWQEFRRFFVKLFLFSVGIEALFRPDSEQNPPHTWQQWSLIAMLFGVVILLNYSTLAAMRFRHQFIYGDKRDVEKDADELEQ